MKKWHLIFIVPVFLFISCKKEVPENYYYTFGELKKTDDSAIINTDGDLRLLIRNPGDIPITVENADRVYSYFSFWDETAPQGIDFCIKISSIESINVKEVIDLTENNADSIGNDPMSVDNLWISNKYLNFGFTLIGSSQQTHLINLIKYAGEITSDTINLEIRHNNNDDAGTYYLYGFISFDLSQIEIPGKNSVTLRIKAKEYNSRTFEKFYTYKY